MIKTYNVSIELDSVDFKIKANNATEAKRKALAKLKRKDPTKLIRRSWPDKKKEIHAEEL